MADRTVTTQEAALAGGSVIANSLAHSSGTPLVAKLRLFKSTLVPDEGTTRQNLIDAEADFDDYPAGGYDITDYAGPTFGPLGVAVISSNLISVAFDAGPAGNTIGGFWVEDASEPDPKVRDVRIYDPPRPVLAPGDGWPIVHQMGYAGSLGV